MTAPHWPTLPSALEFMEFPINVRYNFENISADFVSGDTSSRARFGQRQRRIINWRGHNLSLTDLETVAAFLQAYGTTYFYIDNKTPLFRPYPAPTLAQVAGGAKGARTYHVKYTWYNSSTADETTPSEESSLAVDANKLLTVTIPKNFPTSVDQARVYIGISGSGTEKLELNPISTDQGTWTEPVGALNQGAAPPSTNAYYEEICVRLQKPGVIDELRTGVYVEDLNLTFEEVFQ